MTYPRLLFKKQPNHGSERTRYRVYGPDGADLGSVYSLYTGGWSAVTPEGALPGYATRYEAGYSLFTSAARTVADAKADVPCEGSDEA